MKFFESLHPSSPQSLASSLHIQSPWRSQVSTFYNVPIILYYLRNTKKPPLRIWEVTFSHHCVQILLLQKARFFMYLTVQKFVWKMISENERTYAKETNNNEKKTLKTTACLSKFEWKATVFDMLTVVRMRSPSTKNRANWINWLCFWIYQKMLLQKLKLMLLWRDYRKKFGGGGAQILHGLWSLDESCRGSQTACNCDIQIYRSYLLLESLKETDICGSTSTFAQSGWKIYKTLPDTGKIYKTVYFAQLCLILSVNVFKLQIYHTDQFFVGSRTSYHKRNRGEARGMPFLSFLPCREGIFEFLFFCA